MLIAAPFIWINEILLKKLIYVIFFGERSTFGWAGQKLQQVSRLDASNDRSTVIGLNGWNY